MNGRFSRVLASVGGKLPSALTLAFALLCVVSCQSIAGIEDYRLGHCGEFCDTVMQNCTAENQVYHSRATCMGFCALLREGDLGEGDQSNTLACRLSAAKQATSEPDVYCQQAGPGGATQCGPSECDNYCSFFSKVCPDLAATQPSCSASCQGLRDKGSLNSEVDHEGDTLQCRLVHVSAATGDPVAHCPHAQLAHPTAYCTDEAEKPPHPLSCDDYCRLVNHVCAGNVAVYESQEQCKAVCSHLDLGEPGDQALNTVACRKYHSQNAISDATAHCPHAGPGGDGHCGDKEVGNCESYCHLLGEVCSAEFEAEFTDSDGCMTACATWDHSAPNSKFSVEKTLRGQDAFGCRLLAVSRAAVNQALCAQVMDDSACQ